MAAMLEDHLYMQSDVQGEPCVQCVFDSSVCVRFSPQKGRYLVAHRDFSKGEAVLVEQPYDWCTADPYNDIVCARCGRMADTMYGADEESPKYCSDECLSLDYDLMNIGRAAMKSVRRLPFDGSKDSLRLIARLGIRRKHESERILMHESHNLSAEPISMPLRGNLCTFERVMTLQSHAANHPIDIQRGVQQVGDLIVSEILDENDLPISGPEAAELLFIIQSNAHRITQFGGVPIGLGLFPLTSLMNHSCNPNCVHHFSLSTAIPNTARSTPKLVMRALKDIKAGEELTYSYVDLYQSTASRRQQLRHAYFFHCECQRCVQATIPDEPADASEDKFPYDEMLDAGVEGVDPAEVARIVLEVQQQINLSSSLLARSRQVNLLRSVIGKTKGALTDPNKAGKLHPFHRTLLQLYVLHSKISAELARVGRPEADWDVAGVRLTTAQHALLCESVAFGTVALAAMRRFARVMHTDVADLSLVVGKALWEIFQSNRTPEAEAKSPEGAGHDAASTANASAQCEQLLEFVTATLRESNFVWCDHGPVQSAVRDYLLSILRGSTGTPLPGLDTKGQYAVRMLRNAADVYVCICGPGSNRTEEGIKVKNLLDEVNAIVMKASDLNKKKSAGGAAGAAGSGGSGGASSGKSKKKKGKR